MAEILSGIVEKARGAISSGTDLVICIIGAGSTAALVEVVKSWLPEQTAGMADEVIAAIAGFLLFYFGDRLHPLLTPFGLGAFLAGVGAWSAAFTSGMLLMLKKK